MLIGEWVGLAGLVGANAAIGIGIYKYFNSRIDRVFQRFDEYKEKVERDYLRKDSCNLLHNTTAQNLVGLEGRIEKRFDKLEEQIMKALQE